MKLASEFFVRDPETVARDLLGRHLVRQTPARTYRGIIAETGAYQGHSGKREGKEGMYRAPGILYVWNYRGQNFLNISTTEEDTAAVVFIRELYPMQGINRSVDGPGKVTKALEIDASFDGMSIENDVLWIEGEGVDQQIVRPVRNSSMASNCLGYFRMRL